MFREFRGNVQEDMPVVLRVVLHCSLVAASDYFYFDRIRLIEA